MTESQLYTLHSYDYTFLLHHVPSTILYAFGILSGIVGNFLIIGSILYSRELRVNSTYMLILNQSIAELFISLIVDAAPILGLIYGAGFFQQNFDLCVFIAASCLISCGTSLVSMGFLAFNRYIAIVHSKQFGKYFSFRLTIIYCIIAWLFGFLIDLPNFTEWGGHVFDQKTLACLFDRLKKEFTVAFAVLVIIMPCLAIGFCYLKIFLFVRSGKSRFVNMPNRMKLRNDSLRLAKSVFASFILFAICWLPVALILILGVNDSLPAAAHIYANMFAHLNSAFNPIFYAFFNPRMRQAYRAFLSAIFKKAPVQSSSGSSSKTSVNCSTTRTAPISFSCQHSRL
nr:G protein-coupled receptor [Proales similis]